MLTDYHKPNFDYQIKKKKRDKNWVRKNILAKFNIFLKAGK